MIKKYYDSFITYSKRHFLENKKTILINLLIFFGLVVFLLLIDQLTKSLLFKGKMENGELKANEEILHKNGLFIIRSVANPGVTFFGTGIPTWILHILSILIFIVCSIFAIYSHDKLLIIAIAFTFSGTFGNFLDRAMFNGFVKDILQITAFQGIPFLGGVFNFADVWLFVGSTLAIIYLILLGYRHYKHNKF